VTAAENPAERYNRTLPFSAGGVIEAVKRGIMVALRQAFEHTSLESPGRGAMSIDFEYPLTQQDYPGIWVQFSLTDLRRVGIAHEVIVEEGGVWCPVQEWSFSGRVTLTIVALSSLQRDQLADVLITVLAFSRPPQLPFAAGGVITKDGEDTRQFRQLMQSIADNPYVSMTINSDTILPGGQGVSQGTPWAQEVLAYEDNYSFDLIGQFNVIFRHDGTYELQRVDGIPRIWDSYQWQ
jgi:hypothetical protein